MFDKDAHLVSLTVEPNDESSANVDASVRSHFSSKILNIFLLFRKCGETIVNNSIKLQELWPENHWACKYLLHLLFTIENLNVGWSLVTCCWVNSGGMAGSCNSIIFAA